METEIIQMHSVWKEIKIPDESLPKFDRVDFDEILSSIFSTGPFYFYIIDFKDMSISHLSSGFEQLHGISPDNVGNINDILNLIHPDDMEFVTKVEDNALKFIFEKIGGEKFTKYKGSYNMRFKTTDGYNLFNHQALALQTDEENRLIKSLNIHTNISHITEKNNYKFSLIGLAGEPSYLNLDVVNEDIGQNYYPAPENIFTKREIEIIKLLADGQSTKSIAEKLFISPATVETHRKNILRKSGCENSVMLIAKSISECWI